MAESSGAPQTVSTMENIQARLLSGIQGGSSENKPAKGENKDNTETLSAFHQAALSWADCRFKSLVTGDISIADGQRALEGASNDVFFGESGSVSGSELLDPKNTSARDILMHDRIISEPIGIDALPQSAEAFNLLDPGRGKLRMITSFNDQMATNLSELIAGHLTSYITDNEPAHLEQIRQLTEFAIAARRLYSGFTERQLENMNIIRQRLKYLGMDKSLVVDGDDGDLISALQRSVDFGRASPEDRGRKDRESIPKNKIITGENPSMIPLNTTIKNAAGVPIAPMHDERLLDSIKRLTTDQGVAALREKYKGNEEIIDLIDWVRRQAVVRQLLPRELQIPERHIDMEMLTHVKDLGVAGASSDQSSFQASNPISLYVDSETNRKFVVKKCPDQTLQSDYFGLEMLQLGGVPIYEFYIGYLPNPSQPSNPRRVLVTGFLDGFKDPSQLVDLPKGSPTEAIKTLLPDSLKQDPIIQRGLLIELLISEYNTKAHNLMVLGQSTQHLDQGACLTSTASGKFKGFSETVTIQDVQDVLHCYTDWDPNLEQSVNEAYASIATVESGKLIIHDIAQATHLLRQLNSIPQEKIDLALQRAGYSDGPYSVARVRAWRDKIRQELIPEKQKKAQEEIAKSGHASKRTEQYLRWYQSAIDTFERISQEGGELSYYKKALRSRRASLTNIWQKAIDEAQTPAQISK